MASPFSSGPPHKLSSIISSLLTQRQPGQVNSNPSLTTAAALWARHSQHLKNSRIEKDVQPGVNICPKNPKVFPPEKKSSLKKLSNFSAFNICLLML